MRAIPFIACLLSASSAPLAEAREQLIELGKQRNACIDALLLIEQ